MRGEIDIRINDESLELAPGTKIKMVLQSPLFSSELVQGDYSFPITLPGDSKVNQRLLNFPHIIENADAMVDYDCDVYISKIHFARAVLKILKVSTSGFQVFIVSRAGVFKSKIKDKKLSTLELGGSITCTDGSVTGAGALQDYIYANDILNKFFPDVNFSFPMFLNDGFFDVELGELDEWFVNRPDPSVSVPQYLLRVSTNPFLYLWFILKQICEENGHTISGNAYDDEELRKIIVYNNYRLPPVLFIPPDLVPSEITIDPKNHVPDMLIEDFINAIKTYLFIAVIVDPLNQNLEFKTLKSIITSIDYTDITSIAEPNPTVEKSTYNGVTLEYNIDDNDRLLSDSENKLDGETVLSPVADYAALVALTGVKAADVRFVIDGNQYWKAEDDSPFPNWRPFVYAEVVTNTNKKNTGYTILSAVADIASLPSASGDGLGAVRFVTELNQYFIVKDNGSFYWDFFTDNLDDYVIDNGDEKISSQASTVGMSVININNWGEYSGISRNYLVPRARIKGTAVDYFQGVNPFGLRLFTYQGMHNDSAGNKYPFATSDVYNYEGTKVGQYGLSFAGENGIYETLAKEWLAFIKRTFPSEWKINYTLVDLLNIDWTKKERIRDVNYLKKQITVEFPITDAATTILMKC